MPCIPIFPLIITRSLLKATSNDCSCKECTLDLCISGLSSQVLTRLCGASQATASRLPRAAHELPGSMVWVFASGGVSARVSYCTLQPGCCMRHQAASVPAQHPNQMTFGSCTTRMER